MICKIARRVPDSLVVRSPARKINYKRLQPKMTFKRVVVNQIFREVKPCK